MTVYVVGAGMAGLSAAFRLVKNGQNVVVCEAAEKAGGRCASFFDKTTGAVLDNGTHVLMSANTALTGMLAACDPRYPLKNAGDTLFIYDTAAKKRFSLSTATPVKSAFSFFKAKDLLVESVMDTPAGKADKMMFFNTLFKCLHKNGGDFLLAEPSLYDCVVAPVVDFLTGNGVSFRFGHTLSTIFTDRLVFRNKTDVPLSKNDAVILALPAASLSRLIAGIPELPFSSILNVHYRSDAVLPEKMAFCGLLNGFGHFVFARAGVVSVTVSAADGLLKKYSPSFIAGKIWSEIFPLLQTDGHVPVYRFIVNKRATLFQDKKTNAARFLTDIGAERLFLAGDATETGLPCTVEGAVRAGFAAADAVLTA